MLGFGGLYLVSRCSGGAAVGSELIEFDRVAREGVARRVEEES